eukprot:Skav205768  [mRNA]  locus=scaffold1714:475377:480883:- [translate_table: standard]
MTPLVMFPGTWVCQRGRVRVLKALDHPHVIRIYEAFERRETLHIVMDWAEGGTLASVLSTERVNGRSVGDGDPTAASAMRTLTEAWACTAAQQMCAALEYIHFKADVAVDAGWEAKGVVHCDLKPENAMLLRAVEPVRTGDGHGPAPSNDSAQLAAAASVSEKGSDATDSAVATTTLVETDPGTNPGTEPLPILNQVVSQALWHPEPGSKAQQVYAEWLDYVQWNRGKFGLPPDQVSDFRTFMLENLSTKELTEVWNDAEALMASWGPGLLSQC